MKSSVEKTNTSAKFSIEFDAKDFEPARLKALNRLAKNIKVAGFREGKAPANIVEQHVDPNKLATETLDVLVRTTIPKVFNEEGLLPISTPHVDVIKFIPGESAEITITADIMPEVEFCDYESLKADYVKQTIVEADVDDVLNRIAESFAETEVVKRAAKDGDETVIDFTGKKDGVAFDGGSAKDFKLRLGSGQFIPGFEDGIVGHEVGDKFDLNLTFPEDYGNADLAGQKVVFEVLLKQVNEIKKPAIDDELAKKTGAFDTLGKLKADILKNLEEQAKRAADDRYKDALLDELVKGSKTEAPQTLVKEQIEMIRSDLLRNLNARKMQLETWLKNTRKTMEEWEKEVELAATNRVLSSIVVQKLGDELGIEIADEDVEEQLNLMRQSYAKSPEALKDLEDPRTKASIRNRMRVNAIMDKLVEINLPHAKQVDPKDLKPKTEKKSDKKADKKAHKKSDKKADKKAKKSK